MNARRIAGYISLALAAVMVVLFALTAYLQLVYRMIFGVSGQPTWIMIVFFASTILIFGTIGTYLLKK